MRVFISYTHDSTEHLDRVWDFCERLRKAGIECVIDQHESSPAEGWPRWCRNQIQESQFVLVVCTESYRRRYEGKEEEGKGLGAKWEGYVITQELYEAEGRNSKFIPVVFPSNDARHIPTELRGATRYVLDGWKDYDELFRRLTDQPARQKSDVARQIRSMPLRPRKETFSSPPWNVPLARNLFFTGREDKLKEIEDGLRASGAVAVTGMGGTGKTQAATEYAYRHRANYTAVLWASAASRERLISDFAALAGRLNLALKDDPDQNLVAEAVRQWLACNAGWLLILDNADDPTVARDLIVLPDQGHILLTTQAQATGAIHRIPIKDMLPDDGVLLLLRRAKKIGVGGELSAATESDRHTASQISVELGGLPLALDQAGAYIEETGCGLRDYLELYRQRREVLLKRRGSGGLSHPDSVATTLALSFEKVEGACEAAAELLRFSAFLYPDAIPEEILTRGASELGPALGPVAREPLKLNAAFAEALKYSLLGREPGRNTFSIHNLVQAVLKEGMNDTTQLQWIERAIRAAYLAFPEGGFHNWAQCERWLPQALVCADLAVEWKLKSGEVAWVINQAASYLLERGHYIYAEPLCKMAVRIWEEVFGPEHIDVAVGLNNLAGFYHVTGDLTRAGPLYKRALEIKQKALGPEHPDVASGLKSLATLYREQGKYAEAEPLFQRALTIREKALGPEHPDVAASLNGIAVLFSDQGKLDEAEPLYRRALAIREKTLDPNHPDLAMSLSNLATLFVHQGRCSEAEPLFRRALTISERALGPNHPDVARVLGNYARLLREQKRVTAAKGLEARAEAIRGAHTKRIATS